MKQVEPYIPATIPIEDRKAHERAGVGMRVGFGQKAAVLVVDMCRYTVDSRYALSFPETAVPAAWHIAKLLSAARPLGVPVIFTTQRSQDPYLSATGGLFLEKAAPADSDFATESAPHDIVDDVRPLTGEVVLVKPKPSVFFGTQLASILIYQGVDTLIVTGVATSGCVRATVDHAAAYNFRTIVPKECVADRFQISHEVALFNMDAFTADVMSLDEVVAGVVSQNLDSGGRHNSRG